MAVVQYVANLGCSLDTLHLAFTIRLTSEEDLGFHVSDYDLLDLIEDQYRPAFIMSTNWELVDAIAALKVKNWIEIAIISEEKYESDIFERFVRGIGHLKQWAIQEDLSKDMSNEDFDDSIWSQGLRWREPLFHSRTWVLQPATADTEEDIPELPEIWHHFHE